MPPAHWRKRGVEYIIFSQEQLRAGKLLAAIARILVKQVRFEIDPSSEGRKRQEDLLP